MYVLCRVYTVNKVVYEPYEEVCTWNNYLTYSALNLRFDSVNCTPSPCMGGDYLVYNSYDIVVPHPQAQPRPRVSSVYQ